MAQSRSCCVRMYCLPHLQGSRQHFKDTSHPTGTVHHPPLPPQLLPGTPPCQLLARSVRLHRRTCCDLHTCPFPVARPASTPLASLPNPDAPNAHDPGLPGSVLPSSSLSVRAAPECFVQSRTVARLYLSPPPRLHTRACICSLQILCCVCTAGPESDGLDRCHLSSHSDPRVEFPPTNDPPPRATASDRTQQPPDTP